METKVEWPGDMPEEEFRRFASQASEWIADYFNKIEDLPVLSQVSPGWLKEQISPTAPDSGEDFAAILADMDKLILPASTHWNHPHFHGLFSTSTSGPGILAEMLAAALDMKAMLWRTSPASAELEDAVLGWLRDMTGLPDVFEGIIYDTASVSTMHAIAAARERARPDIRELGMSGRDDLPLLRVYCSVEAHSSVDKACIALGLGLRSLKKIECNDVFEMKADALAAAIEADLAEGIMPFCVVATIGTTSTTAVDPVEEIARICESYGLWLHVDAAYAGPAAILPELRPLFSGWEKADSIVMNPHKWLFTPFDLSAFYCRDMASLRRAFSLVPEYLRTADSATVKNGMDYGFQLGRRFRALKLWFVIRYFGREGIAARLRNHCRLARDFADWIRQSENFELMAPTPFALVCFRAVPKHLAETQDESGLDEFNERLMNKINASGKAYLSHTKLKGRLALRFSVGSIRIMPRHIEEMKELLTGAVAEIGLSMQ
ncbi:MAG: pyridoxal-dependent decarboxylase [Acidobacteriota bacterium]